MEKKKFKNVLSKAFVVAIAAAAVGSVNVNAANIRETAGNEIEEGSYIIGITRFTNDMNLTAGRVMIATQNDVFHHGLVNYTKPSVYQYLFGQWIKYDDNTNEPSVASDAEIARLGLNAQDIFYVNNIEKVISVAYDSTKATGCTFIAVTPDGNETINYSNGELTVPATASAIQVMKGAEVVETLNRTNTNDNGDFNYTSQGNKYFGSISMDNIITKSGATVNGETITIGGTINWVDGSVQHGVDLDGKVNDPKSGYRVGVKITAPDGTNLDNVKNIKVKFNDKETTFDAANAGQKGSFWFTPIVETGKTYEVEVIWTDDIPSQKFNIVVNGTLAPMPAGTISGEPIVVTDKDGNDVTLITATSSESKVTFSGTEMPWDGAIAVKVKLNDLYANNASYTKAGVKAYYSETKQDSDGYDYEEKTYVIGNKDAFADVNVSQDKDLVLNTLKFEDFATKRKITVSVKWDANYTQDFEVVLDNNTPFEHPETVLSAVTTLGKTGNWEVSEDGTSVTVTHTEIDWDSTNGGTYVSGKLSVPISGTGIKYEVADMANLTVKIDGVEQGEIVKDKFVAENFQDDGTFDFKLYLSNANNKITNETHKIEVVWAGKTIQTFNVIIDEVLLGQAPVAGAKAVPNADKYQYDLINGVYRVYMDELIDVLDKDNKTTGRKVNASIPFNYEKGANTVATAFTNSAYAGGAEKVEVDGKEIKDNGTVDTEGNKLYDIPVSNSITVVKVYWDSKNVQEFQIAPHASLGTLESATSGTANVTGETTNTSTTLNYKGDVVWNKNDTANVVIKDEKAEEASGYRANIDITAPTRRTVTVSGGVGTITNPSINEEKTIAPIVTITGGKYTDKKVTVTPEVNDETITINPIVTSSSDVLTIKVQWYGEDSYEETYTVRFNGASLTDNGGTLNVSNYIGTAEYNAGKHTIPVKLTKKLATNTISSITVDDAGVTTVDGKRTPRTIDVTSDTNAKTEFDFNLEVSNDVRVLKVYVTYADNFKQEFAVDATETVIPTIIMREGLEKSDESGVDYVINATAGQNIGRLVTSVLPNTSAITYDVVDETVVTVTDGTFVANKIGSTKVTLSMKTKEDTPKDMAKPIVVRINVVNNALTANSTATLDGKKTIKVVSTLNGGTSKAKTVEAQMFELKDGVYTPYGTKATATINADGKYEMVLSNNNADLPEDIIVKVTSKDADYVVGTPELENLRKVEWLNVSGKASKQYTVTFDNDGATQTQTIDAKIDDADSKVDGTIKELPVVTKETITTPNGNKKVYTFEGWYLSTDFNEDGSLKDTAQKLAVGEQIEKDVTYKAHYTVETVVAE